MSDTILDRFTIGQGKILPVDHTGPVSYPAGGETLGTTNNLTGIAELGMGSVDMVLGSGSLSLSGNYIVRSQQIGTGVRKTSKLLWYNAGASGTQPGVPLSLGTLSAAATQSTYTVGGLVTVATTTPPPLGSLIVLSNGATTYGIRFDGVMVLVTAVVPGVSYSFYFGQGSAGHYTVNTDTLKYQVVQVTAGNPLQAQALAAPITGVLATANLLTITQANTLSPGDFVYLNGPFVSASVYALGAIVQVATATGTGWTANWQGTIIAQTSGEVAVASLLVTNGGVPIASYPYLASPAAAITNSLAVASASGAAGLLTLTAAQVYQPGMLIVMQNVGNNTQLDGTIATVISTGLTQAIIKANGWTVIANTSAETEGFAAVIATGTAGDEIGAGDVAAGTNLSGETVRIAFVGK